MMKALAIPKKLCAILTVIIIASFIGFCVENLWILLRHGFIDNRGMRLPFLFGYGIACIAMYLCFGLPDSPKFFSIEITNTSYTHLIYAIFLFVAIMIGESMLGHIIEFFTSIQWWDYSSIPFHIGRYTSVPTSIGFTFGAFIFFDKLFPALYDMGEKIYSAGLSGVIIIVTTLLLLDNIHALTYMHKYHHTYSSWKYEQNIERNITH